MRTKGASRWCGVAVAALALGLSGSTSWAQTAGSSSFPAHLRGAVTRLDSKVGIGRVKGATDSVEYRFKLKNVASADSVKLGTSVKLLTDKNSLRLASSADVSVALDLSWVCTPNWKKCWCIPGDDCDGICKTSPKPGNCPGSICTCKGDPTKGDGY